MNQRIKQLSKEAFEYALSQHPGSDEFQPIWTEKFAELIVKECIKEVEGLQVLQSTLDWSQHWNRAIAHTALHIRDHFGVEE